MPGLVFRVIWDGAESGATNMARDEALLEGVGGGAPPTLRFYGWSRPTLSLGYFQKEPPVPPERLRQAGVDLVRRPTGGSAVLHHREVTYSVIVPLSLLPQGSGETARFLGEGLAMGLRRLGLHPTLNLLPPPRAPLCFTIPGLYEPVVGGRKLVGSARRRRRGALLEHGSLLLQADPRWWGLLPDVEALHSRAVSLAELRHPLPTEEEVRMALLQGFLERFGATGVFGAPTPLEGKREQALRPTDPTNRQRDTEPQQEKEHHV